MPFGPASELGVSLYEETDPIEVWPGRSDEEVEAVICAVYRQVLGNAYVMESERLSIAESQFKRGELSVREFVRQVAKSALYRTRFFESCPRYRATELNFKHLLGRAPNSYEEMKAHSDILDREGFEADIDSYIDSDEYQDTFGENIVPYVRGYKTQTGKNMVGFTHMFQLMRGPSSSDFKGSLAGNRPRLNKLVIQGTPTAVVPPSGGVGGWSFQDSTSSARTRLGVGATEGGKVYRIEVTGYGSPGAVNRVSKFRRSNKVFLVSFDELSKTYQQIHKQGGKIASISAVN
ncbi:phycobilisome linker polypeptide [Roseofilum reptotaenium CS-1145]|uniref:Photosystem I reaction center subunit XII n=1 Tax=Roseofilum reptotaenium AO1-A TaxID=1925591 RepID=A0A1L9QS40_9CYAN|nr:phycobilisome linker polypeptide [Roseofilum reptotaenium]MDB9518318.1 phycobilisome linker polypeptide [Roseofilum reptotaenium CS-1145]OJJ25484.1 photosystem I reaction center subunit XII [Roseofilum reptotaenium AO1-A]